MTGRGLWRCAGQRRWALPLAALVALSCDARCASNGTPIAPAVVPGHSDRVLQLAAGADYTCVRRQSGRVQCWGQGSDGQLGDGPLDAVPVSPDAPVAVRGLEDATDISAGRSHACALRARGGIVCWGSNADGALGDGTHQRHRRPVAVTGIDDAVAISAGDDFTCALHRGGTVSCWGLNRAWILGDGGTRHEGCGAPGEMAEDCSTHPLPVPGVRDVAELDAGDKHVCARRTNGTVVCWGTNNMGELGDATTLDRGSPVEVRGLADAVALAAGATFTCAVRANGTVACWGLADDGTLGDGLASHQVSQDGLADCAPTPSAVEGLANAVDVSAGAAHACARRTDGSVLCWGRDDWAQLGDGVARQPRCERRAGNAVACSRIPVSVADVGDAARLDVGWWHACTLDVGGSVRCWGRGDLATPTRPGSARHATWACSEPCTPTAALVHLTL